MIQQQLRASGEREVKSRLIGEMVMTELGKLDKVAYVRFASVYRDFQDVEAFQAEIDKLNKNEPTPWPIPSIWRVPYN